MTDATEPRLHDVDHRTTVVGGSTISYYDTDPGTGARTLLLVHGSSGSAYSSFAALHPMLAMRRRVVAFDFVDPEDAAAATSEHYLAQVEGVLDAIGGSEPVDVLGYSFGAVIAALLAARSPRRVHRLALLAGWAATDAQQRLRNDLWFALARREHERETLGDFAVLTAHSARYLNTLTPTEFAATRARTAATIADRATKMHFNRSVDIRAELDAIAAETLVIGCSEDQMAPVHHAQLLFGTIRNACYAEVLAGHAVTIERPAEVATVVSRFLDDPNPLTPGTIVEPTHA